MCALVVGFLISGIAATVGCGSGATRAGTARVRGTVTIDGQPIPSDARANITFRPAAGTSGRTAGAPVVDGRYDCTDAPVGDVKVYISIMRPTGRMITESDNRPFAEMGSAIADKYATGIDLEITGDSTDQDFDLEASGG